MLGFHIDGHKEISKNKPIKEFKQSKVYIPLICGNDTDLEVKVKVNDKVLIGDIIAVRKGNLELPIHSSISGKVVDFTTKTIYNGNKINSVVIESDNKENKKILSTKELNKYSKNEYINLLKDAGIRGLGGADFPTYIKYQTDKKIKNLIINAVECEPYITADYMLMKDKYQEILEIIDAIMTINNIDNAYLAIKKHNTDIIDLFNSFIGMYPKIKLIKIPDLYPMGWEKNLVRYILKKDYDRLPIEVNTVINNVSTIYAIYDTLKNGNYLTNRIVTITGEMIKEPININVKIGTDLKDIIKELGIKKGNNLLVAGGPMMGINIPNEELVVTSNLNCVLVLKEQQEEIEQTCLRCGKCVNNCPAKLSPVLIKDNLDDIDNLKYLETQRCVECGLCSYVCPAKINVREYIRKAKQNIRRD